MALEDVNCGDQTNLYIYVTCETQVALDALNTAAVKAFLIEVLGTERFQRAHMFVGSLGELVEHSSDIELTEAVNKVCEAEQRTVTRE